MNLPLPLIRAAFGVPNDLRERPGGLALIALCTFLFNACGAAASREPAASGPYSEPALGVMTFNLRYAHTTPPDLWPDRRPVVREVIERWAPDIIGTQEGQYHQIRDMAADLPEYAWIGLGRDGGSRGEFMAVFYRPDRLDPLEWDHYWLSDTPALMGSMTWGNQYARMVTWIRFRDRATGAQFILANTHLDHEVQEARERSAQLILDRARDWPDTVPVLLIGDFNAAAGDNPVYEILTTRGGFREAWHPGGPADSLGTFHGFGGTAIARGRPRIDWILMRGACALSSEIVTHERGGQYPSDHFPVLARVRLASAGCPS